MPFLSSLPTVDPQSVVDGAKLWSGPGYIDGLQMQWVSATAVTVSSGRAYIPSLGYYLDAPNAIALTGLVLAASTFYHLYLYNNAGTPAIECVTTAPAAPYSGTARAKTGDTSRRYVGSIVTDGSSNIVMFDHSPYLGSVDYIMNINNAPLHPVHFGAATTATVISLSGAVPATSRRVNMYVENSDTGSAIVFISSPPLDPITDVLTFIRPGRGLSSTYLLDINQNFNYSYNGAPAAGTGFDAWVLGYFYER